MSVITAVPLERIDARAAETNPKKALLTIVAGFFYLLGYVLGAATRGVMKALIWVHAAFMVGVEAQRGPSKARKIMLLESEVDRLQKENDRILH